MHRSMALKQQIHEEQDEAQGRHNAWNERARQLKFQNHANDAEHRFVEWHAGDDVKCIEGGISGAAAALAKR